MPYNAAWKRQAYDAGRTRTRTPLVKLQEKLRHVRHRIRKHSTDELRQAETRLMAEIDGLGKETRTMPYGRNTVDEHEILKHARHLVHQGIYPGPTAIANLMGWKHNCSVLSKALANLRAAGLLVVPEAIDRRKVGAPEGEPSYDADQIKQLAREVRFDGTKQAEPKRPRTLLGSLASDYWTPERRAMYRRQA